MYNDAVMGSSTGSKADILPIDAKKTDLQYIFIFIGVVFFIFFLLVGISIALYFLYFKNIDFNGLMEDGYKPEETNTYNKVDTKKNIPAKRSVVIKNNLVESTSSNSVNIKTTTNTNKSTPTPVTTTTTTKPAKVETYAPGPTYYKYSVGDPFNVTKSYVYDDYVKIMSAYNGYVGVNNMIPYTKNAIKMTCDGSDFFADSCERNKKRLKEEEAEKDRYEAQVWSIFSKGK